MSGNTVVLACAAAGSFALMTIASGMASSAFMICACIFFSAAMLSNLLDPVAKHASNILDDLAQQQKDSEKARK